MVNRLPPLSTLWVPLTILLFAASLGIGQGSGKETDDTDGESTTNATKRNLTGIPQIDYKTDPNLPRELNGYDLSDYPFFNKVPSNISFKCDGLKDGFYASVEHKCQLYHHCLFGTRYDFLCANYTAFDQRTFICQFVSDVDCPNSALFFHRNDELYVSKSTTTEAPAYRPRGRQQRIRPQIAPPVPRAQPAAESGVSQEPSGSGGSSGAAAPAPIATKPSGTAKPGGAEVEVDDYYDDYDYPVRPRRPPRRRRPWRRKRPIYTDYDDYDDYYDLPRRRVRPRYHRRDDYETESEEDLPPRRLKKRKERPRSKLDDLDYQDEPEKPSKQIKSTTTTTTPNPNAPTTEPPPLDPAALAKTREELFSMSRVPPKIKPPVPLSERSKFNQMYGRPVTESSSPSTPTTISTTPAGGKSGRKINSSSKSAESEQYDQYYDEEYDQQQQAPAKKSSKYVPFVPPTTTTTTTTTRRSTTTSTSTTTPSPVYEYEYEEYEYDQATHKEPITTSTTTTSTTTVRPGYARDRRFRGARKQSDPDQLVKPTVQESNIQENNIVTPTTSKNSQLNEAVETNSRVPPARQPFTMNRQRSNFFSKNTPTTPPPTTTTTTTTSTTSTERTTLSPRQYLRNRPASVETQTQGGAFPEVTTLRSRGSRFWQRPTTLPQTTTTTTTTTTAAPISDVVDYVYYDDNAPLPRYGQRSATTYQQYSPAMPDYAADAPQPTAPAAPIPATQSEPNPSREDYQSSQVRSRFPVGKSVEQSNYVTPFSAQSIIPKTTTATYLQFNHHPQPPQSRPEFISLLPEDEEEAYYPTGGSDPGSSHMMSLMSSHNAQSQPQQQQQTQFQTQQQSQQTQFQPQQSQQTQFQPQQSQQPQFQPPQFRTESQSYQEQQNQPISQQHQRQQFLPEPSQSPTSSRFRNQITRMFTSPQELYPVYTTPPQYVKTVRARHVFPTMFIPFANY